MVRYSCIGFNLLYILVTMYLYSMYQTIILPNVIGMAETVVGTILLNAQRIILVDVQKIIGICQQPHNQYIQVLNCQLQSMI